MGVENLGDGRGVVLELLQKRRGDSEEIDAGKGFDLAGLSKEIKLISSISDVR